MFGKVIKVTTIGALSTSIILPGFASEVSAAVLTIKDKKLIYKKSGKTVKGFYEYKGILYKNGKKNKGYALVGTGASMKLYYNASLKKGYKTAKNNSYLFKDGRLVKGYKSASKNQRLYYNGVLTKGYEVYKTANGERYLYQNGYLKKGLKLATRQGETILFKDGVIPKGHIIFKYKLYTDGVLNTVFTKVEDKYYQNGILANGVIDGKNYKDGMFVEKPVELTEEQVIEQLKAKMKASQITLTELHIQELEVASLIKKVEEKTTGAVQVKKVKIKSVQEATDAIQRAKDLLEKASTVEELLSALEQLQSAQKVLEVAIQKEVDELLADATQMLEIAESSAGRNTVAGAVTAQSLIDLATQAVDSVVNTYGNVPNINVNLDVYKAQLVATQKTLDNNPQNPNSSSDSGNTDSPVPPIVPVIPPTTDSNENNNSNTENNNGNTENNNSNTENNNGNTEAVTIEKALADINMTYMQGDPYIEREIGVADPVILAIVKYAAILEIDLTDYYAVEIPENITFELNSSNSLTVEKVKEGFYDAVAVQKQNEEQFIQSVNTVLDSEGDDEAKQYQLPNQITEYHKVLGYSRVAYDALVAYKQKGDADYLLALPLDADYSNVKNILAVLDAAVKKESEGIEDELVFLELQQFFKNSTISGVKYAVAHAQTLGLDLTEYNKLELPQDLTITDSFNDTDTFKQLWNAVVAVQLQKEQEALAAVKDATQDNIAQVLAQYGEVLKLPLLTGSGGQFPGDLESILNVALYKNVKDATTIKEIQQGVEPVRLAFIAGLLPINDFMGASGDFNNELDVAQNNEQKLIVIKKYQSKIAALYTPNGTENSLENQIRLELLNVLSTNFHDIWYQLLLGSADVLGLSEWINPGKFLVPEDITVDNKEQALQFLNLIKSYTGIEKEILEKEVLKRIQQTDGYEDATFDEYVVAFEQAINQAM